MHLFVVEIRGEYGADLIRHVFGGFSLKLKIDTS